MTVEQFKIKYPQYAHLEGDELWDMMTESLLQSDNILTADPNRTITYHEPVTLNDGYKVFIEDNSTTIWLNSKGEQVILEQKPTPKNPTTSYRMEIINFKENDRK